MLSYHTNLLTIKAVLGYGGSEREIERDRDRQNNSAKEICSLNSPQTASRCRGMSLVAIIRLSVSNSV